MKQSRNFVQSLFTLLTSAIGPVLMTLLLLQLFISHGYGFPIIWVLYVLSHLYTSKVFQNKISDSLGKLNKIHQQAVKFGVGYLLLRVVRQDLVHLMLN